MFTRMVVGVALGCSAVLLTGCESRTGPEKPAPPGKKAAAAAGEHKAPPDRKAAAADRQVVTLHIAGIT